MLRLMLWIALCIPVAVVADTRIWPTGAGCNGSLQACINEVAVAGDTVLIASNGPIDETIFFSKPLNLSAAPGYRPIFEAGNSISAIHGPGAGIAWSMTIQGLTLLGGDVGIRAYSGDATIALRDLAITTTGPTYIGGSLAVDYFPNTAAPGSLQLIMVNNVVTMAGNDGYGLYVTAGTSGGGPVTLDGRVHDNRVTVAPGTNSTGMLFKATGSPSNLRVYSNRADNGINFLPFASMTADFINNAVHCNADSLSTGLYLVGFGGLSTARVFNNTLVDCDTGVYLNSAFASVRMTNNLIAYNANGVSFNSGVEAVISADHNLLFGNAFTQPLFDPGPGSVLSDPKLRRAPLPGNTRLDATSPAIDAGNTADLAALLAANGMGAIDADGSRRVKGASNLVDIGAFEFGDTSFLHRVNNADPDPNQISRIDDVALNFDGARYAQLTANWNPGSNSGIYDNQPIGLVFDDVSSAGYWYLRTENLNSFPDGASFNMFAPAKGNGNFRHVVTAASTSGFTTALNDPGLNNQPDRIVLATRDSADPNGSIYSDPHPFGVFYFAFGGPGSWFVSHLDSTSMNAGGTYHVYWQEPSLTAFTHTARLPNIFGNYTVLDHPLLNGQPCARFHITQSASGGEFNPHYVGLFYATTIDKWAIFNQDLVAMQENAAFNVVIDEAQIYECTNDKLFADGFDL